MSKMLEHTLRTSYSHKNEEKLHINTSANDFLKFNWKITLKNKSLKYIILYMQLTSFIYTSLSQFNNCWVFMLYQVAVHIKFSNCPPLEWTWTHVDTPRHIIPQFQGSWGFYEKFDRHIKCVSKAPLHLRLVLNTLGTLNISTNKNLKKWGQANVKAVPQKLLTYIDIYFFWC